MNEQLEASNTDNPAAPKLSFQLFGGFDAKRDGNSLTKLRYRHADRLLALLILERNRAAKRTWIEDALGITYEGLRQAESVLRSNLEIEDCLIVKNNSLFLDLKGAEIDIVQFEQCINRGDSESLKKAVNLFHGGLLKDWNEIWLLDPRETYQEQYLDAIKQLADDAVKAGNYDSAVTYLRQFTRVLPEMDAAWAQLIDAYGMAGNTILAEDAYAEYCKKLEQRGDQEGRDYRPSPRVVEAIRVARLQTVTRPVVPTPPPAAVNPAALVFEPVGGAVPLSSSYYLHRPADDEAFQAVQQRVSFLLIGKCQ